MKGSFLGLALVAATVLLLSGCAAGLANRAGAEDYTAAVAAEAAAVSLEAADAPPVVPATAQVVKDDAASALIIPAVLSKSVGPGACACGANCECAAELVKLREYQREAEAFFASHGYRSTGAVASVPGYDPGQVVMSGSCANGQCSAARGPVRRLFGRRR